MRLNNRRRLLAGGISIAAAVVVVAATMSASAEPSRAANRWDHVAGPALSGSLSTANAATDAGVEPLVSGPVWKTVRLIEPYSAKFTFVDVGKRGNSPGDYGVFKDPVLNADGIRIGSIDAQCISAYSDQCSGSIRIPGRGQISFGGITPLNVDPDHYPITGGTGQFVGIGGVLVISFPSIDSAALTLTLTK